MNDAGTKLCLFLANDVLIAGREGDVADIAVVLKDGRTTSGMCGGVSLGAQSSLKLTAYGAEPGTGHDISIDAADIVHARVVMNDGKGQVFGSSFAETTAFLEKALAAAKPHSAESIELLVSLASLSRATGDFANASRHYRRAIHGVVLAGDERRQADLFMTLALVHHQGGLGGASDAAQQGANLLAATLGADHPLTLRAQELVRQVS